MYYIVDRDKLPQNRHYELMPDGRAIVSGNEAKVMDNLGDVVVVKNTAELDALYKEMKKSINNKKIEEV